MKLPNGEAESILFRGRRALEYVDGQLAQRGALIPMEDELNAMIAERFPPNTKLDVIVWGRYKHREELQALGVPGLHCVVFRPHETTAWPVELPSPAPLLSKPLTQPERNQVSRAQRLPHLGTAGEPAGLPNAAQNCSLNAVLQCIAHCPGLSHAFMGARSTETQRQLGSLIRQINDGQRPETKHVTGMYEYLKAFRSAMDAGDAEEDSRYIWNSLSFVSEPQCSSVMQNTFGPCPQCQIDVKGPKSRHPEVAQSRRRKKRSLKCSPATVTPATCECLTVHGVAKFAWRKTSLSAEINGQCEEPLP